MDMNSLLSGLGSGKHGGTCNTKGCGCGTGGFGGGNSSIWIWIIILLCCCGGGFGQGAGTGTVCACKKKDCKEYCKCGFDSYGTGGLGGFGGLGGLGGGFGAGNSCWWIIILIFLCFCNGNGIGGSSKGCTTNIINLDDCDNE